MEHWLNDPTIPMEFVPEMLSGAISQGVSAELLAEKVGLSHVLEPERTRVSVRDYISLFSAAQAHLQDEFVGMLPKPVPIGSYLVLCHMLVLCQNLEQALENMDRFYGLFNQRSIWQVSVEDDACRISLVPGNAFQQSEPFYAQLMLLAIYKLFCWLSRQKLELKGMGLAFPRAHHAANLAWLFDCPQQYELQQNYILFDKDVLSLPVLQDNAAIETFSDHYLAYILTWMTSDSLESRVYAYISQELAEGNVLDMEQLAMRLDMSSPTLSRRLQELGLSYQQVKDDVRRDMAMGLLYRGELSIKEIASRLGFSEASAFSRAFKQWMGVSPAEYRRK